MTGDILAIDLSLAATGWATLDNEGIIRTLPTATRYERWSHIIETLTYIGKYRNGLQVWIEQGFAMSTHGRSGGDIAELRGALRWVLERELGVTEWVEVAPTTLKVFATGMGHASKDDMIAAVETWGHTIPYQLSPKTGKALSKKEDGVADALALLHFAHAANGTPRLGGDTAYATRWAKKKVAG